MEKVLNGLVIREVEYRESDKILTLLTESGKLTVTARGAKKPTGKNLSLASLFCNSEFTLNEQNGKLYLSGGTVVAIGGLESGAQLTQSCYQSSWSANTWYALTVGSSTF